MPRQHQWHTDQWYKQHFIPMNQGDDQTWNSETNELTSYGETTKTLTPPLWVPKMKEN